MFSFKEETSQNKIKVANDSPSSFFIIPNAMNLKNKPKKKDWHRAIKKFRGMFPFSWKCHLGKSYHCIWLTWHSGFTSTFSCWSWPYFIEKLLLLLLLSYGIFKCLVDVVAIIVAIIATVSMATSIIVTNQKAEFRLLPWKQRCSHSNFYMKLGPDSCYSLEYNLRL